MKRAANWVDVVGRKFNSLTVISDEGSKNWISYIKCKCDCGNIITANKSSVTTGSRKSCGCKPRPRVSAETIKNMTKHGMCGTSTYHIWATMIQRCTNPNHKKYPRYGGRGVKVCDKWMKFKGFYEDMGERPSGLSIDRRDNDGHYEPSNCRWATNEEQFSNTSCNRFIEFNGLRLTISEWGRKTGIKESTIRARLKSRWTIEKALTVPAKFSPRWHD